MTLRDCGRSQRHDDVPPGKSCRITRQILPGLNRVFTAHR
jgi:hypothetical protein